jgi:hypothetical protein
MKYVKYGKVYGNHDPDVDFDRAYKWLSNYCGYFPQVWLSRSHSVMTGIRSGGNDVLFSFDIIKGFPVKYHPWNYLLSCLFNTSTPGIDPVKDKERYNEILWKEIHKFFGYIRDDEEGQYDPRRHDSLEVWMEKELFIKHDQVVVPSLNLKAAKEVFCKSDKDKSKLRKMGFIKDRIKVRKFPNPWG